MDEKFERESEILDAVFQDAMRTLKGVIELKSLFYESKQSGMNAERRKTPEITEARAAQLASEALYENEGGGNG
jgi:hypothetical protein